MGVIGVLPGNKHGLKVYSPSNFAYRCTASTTTTIGAIQHLIGELKTNPSINCMEITRTAQSEMRGVGNSQNGKLPEGHRTYDDGRPLASFPTNRSTVLCYRRISHVGGRAKMMMAQTNGRTPTGVLKMVIEMAFCNSDLAEKLRNCGGIRNSLGRTVKASQASQVEP
ncbi:hypothetical protein DPSP01_003152 [Paraphaeosphaeria sporulosa]|uniref:Uncharacterized protein n=1 Tax=Paraphaeosphaeria sporulosa TaxID=1460663 RepID=A0A177C246_9PLEO|nr:uncharacterized protein CC84DRAFT_200580 [Paraphaeosphaeria sporulosa]OAG01515.1 hypothetical protein CC84DRAFT_200580 [Paraphaeosphaeria sporulosa]